VEDRIELALLGDPVLIGAAETHRGYLNTETLALGLSLGAEAPGPGAAMDYSEQTEIEGMPLTISLRRSERK
jgi:hypothetical protein